MPSGYYENERGERIDWDLAGEERHTAVQLVKLHDVPLAFVAHSLIEAWAVTDGWGRNNLGELVAHGERVTEAGYKLTRGVSPQQIVATYPAWRTGQPLPEMTSQGTWAAREADGRLHIHPTPGAWPGEDVWKRRIKQEIEWALRHEQDNDPEYAHRSWRRAAWMASRRVVVDYWDVEPPPHFDQAAFTRAARAAMASRVRAHQPPVAVTGETTRLYTRQDVQQAIGRAAGRPVPPLKVRGPIPPPPLDLSGLTHYRGDPIIPPRRRTMLPDPPWWVWGVLAVALIVALMWWGG